MAGSFALALGLISTSVARADLVFVTNTNGNTIGEYTDLGVAVKPSLISGLHLPVGIAISGSNLYVANGGNGTIGEYTTAGATGNAQFISGLTAPVGVAVYGSDLFVIGGSGSSFYLGEYDATTGAPISTALITGLNNPQGIAILSSVPEPSGLARYCLPSASPDADGDSPKSKFLEG